MTLYAVLYMDIISAYHHKCLREGLKFSSFHTKKSYERFATVRCKIQFGPLETTEAVGKDKQSKTKL